MHATATPVRGLGRSTTWLAGPIGRALSAAHRSLRSTVRNFERVALGPDRETVISRATGARV